MSEQENERRLLLKLRKQTILKQMKDLDKSKWDAFKTEKALWETVAELNSSMTALDPSCDTTNVFYDSNHPPLSSNIPSIE